MDRAGNRAGQAGLGRANSGLGQNRVGPKLAPFFWAKILTAQPALKTGLVRPNSILKAKKIRAGRVGPHTGQGHIGPGQIWPDFFWANNLMAQPSPNSERTGLAHRVGPILPPLCVDNVYSGFDRGCSQKLLLLALQLVLVIKLSPQYIVYGLFGFGRGGHADCNYVCCRHKFRPAVNFPNISSEVPRFN